MPSVMSRKNKREAERINVAYPRPVHQELSREAGARGMKVTQLAVFLFGFWKATPADVRAETERRLIAERREKATA